MLRGVCTGIYTEELEKCVFSTGVLTERVMRPLALKASSEDITERVLREMALRDSNREPASG